MSKIFWTFEERQQVLERAVTYHNYGDKSLFNCLKRAQTVLPAERHRNFGSHSAALDLTKELKKMVAKGIPAKTIEPPTQQVEVAPEHIAAQPVMANTLDDLVDLIAKHIAQTFKSQIKTAVRELEHEFKVPKHNPTYASTASRKPRVIIIGLLNDQVHAIKHEFCNDYDLKFIDTDRANGLTPPDADAYLLMQNFINHPLYHKYQGFPNHVLISGGMTTLRMWLRTKGKEL